MEGTVGAPEGAHGTALGGGPGTQYSLVGDGLPSGSACREIGRSRSSLEVLCRDLLSHRDAGVLLRPHTSD